MERKFSAGAAQSLTEKLERYHETKRLAGGITRVMHKGEICYEHAVGYADLAQKRPVTADSIFRIYSMTKPIMMTALMTLFEKGILCSEDNLADYFPEFADMRVAVEHANGTITLEKQTRPITLRELYTMTSGIPYPGEDSAGARIVMEAFQKHSEDMSLPAQMKLLAEEGALCFQPAAKWMYGFSHDVLGAVIEKAADMPLADYMKKTIFDPLGMTDTGFFVPETKRDRFVQAYTVADGAWSRLTDAEFNEQYYTAPLGPSGGGGLTSTLNDYSRFCEMLLRGGRSENARILGEKTVRFMATNQLSPAQTETYSWRERGYGYGIGMRTRLTPLQFSGSVGEFGWDGMMGTWMAIDPQEELTVVHMQNMLPYNTNGLRLMPIIYGGLEK